MLLTGDIQGYIHNVISEHTFHLIVVDINLSVENFKYICYDFEIQP